MIILTLLLLLSTVAKHTQATNPPQNNSPLSTTTKSHETTTSTNFQSPFQFFLNPAIMDAQTPVHQEGEKPEVPKINKLHIRGGPGKIEAVMKSASDAQAAREEYAKEQEAKGEPETGSGKVNAVTKEEGKAEIRGGPGKAEGVMESAGRELK